MTDPINTEDHRKIRKFVELVLDLQKEVVVPGDSREFMIDALTQSLENDTPLKDSIGITPEIIEFSYQQAYNRFQAGKYTEALPIFRFLERLDPTTARYSFATASCYHFLKQYKEAITHYLICSQCDPQNPIPYFHMYDCAKKLENPSLALAFLTKGETIAGDQPQYAQLKTRIQLEMTHLQE